MTILGFNMNIPVASNAHVLLSGPEREEYLKGRALRRKLFLHIGVHRTATSSIQSFLFQNAPALLRRGIFYPYRVRRHDRLMRQIASGEKLSRDVGNELLRRAEQRSRETQIPIHSIILSDEDVSMWHDFGPLEALIEKFDVFPVVALRRQDAWLESWYFQNVKWQWNPELSHLTFDEFMARIDEFHWVHYERLLDRLSSTFGADNLRPYVFEKSQMPDGPVGAFCDRVGLVARSDLDAAPHINESRSPEMTEFMRQLPLGDLDDRTRHAVSVACKHVDVEVLGNSGKQVDRIMPRETRHAVLDRFSKGNTLVAQKYFGRDELFLEQLPAKDAPLAELALGPNPVERIVGPLLLELWRSGALGPRSDER